MNIRKLVGALPLFWRVNFFITAVLILVVGMVEAVLEPLAEIALADLYGGFQAWHEAILWGISILFPSLACSYILSKSLSGKLGRMAKVASAIAHGNLNARFAVTGNSKDEFDLLAQRFNEMAEEIERQMNNERRLLADISHELRSPLARMTIAAELLPRRHKPEERENITNRLNKEITHMNELVSLLLTQAKDKILSDNARSTVNLTEILHELTDDFSFQGEIQNKRIEVELQENLKIIGEPLLLRRMFSNLFSNAMFYTPQGDKVVIKATSSKGKVLVTIRDYGPGVPEGQLEDIFLAFFRVDNSRARSSGGAGLGLALVREAAIAHNGFVEAENADPGLLVTAILPAAE